MEQNRKRNIIGPAVRRLRVGQKLTQEEFAARCQVQGWDVTRGTLAKIEDLPGFCSASLMVNPAERRAVTTVGYDDRSSLEYSREAANAVRDQAARQLEAHIVEVAEFELALAHLHVPEMV